MPQRSKSCRDSGRTGWGRSVVKQGAHPGQVLGGVHPARRHGVDGVDQDGKALFQGAQLFQGFDALEPARGQFGELPQEACPVGVQADVQPCRQPGGQAPLAVGQRVAGPGDGGAGKIQGAFVAPRTVIMRLLPEGATHLSSGRDLPWDDWRAEQGAAPCSAAAGIGRPERFFAMLRAAGVTLSRTLRIPDHQAIPADALQDLPAGPILITPKDAVKCAAPHDPRLWAVRAAPVFSDPGWLDALDRALRTVTRNPLTPS